MQRSEADEQLETDSDDSDADYDENKSSTDNDGDDEPGIPPQYIPVLTEMSRNMTDLQRQMKLLLVSNVCASGKLVLFNGIESSISSNEKIYNKLNTTKKDIFPQNMEICISSLYLVSEIHISIFFRNMYF